MQKTILASAAFALVSPLSADVNVAGLCLIADIADQVGENASVLSMKVANGESVSNKQIVLYENIVQAVVAYNEKELNSPCSAITKPMERQMSETARAFRAVGTSMGEFAQYLTTQANFLETMAGKIREIAGCR